MRRSLHLKIGDDFAKVIPLKTGKYSIGRGEESSIQIESMQVSRHHADILVSENVVEVADCESANGTILNGVPVKHSALKAGDRITIGQAVLEYHQTESTEDLALQKSTLVRPHPQSKTGLHKKTVHLKAIVMLSVALPALLGVSLMAFAFHRSTYENSLAQSLKRGQDLVVQLALENRELLRIGNELLLNIEDVSQEAGVTKAFIYNRKGRILAPLGIASNSEMDPFVTEALTQNSSRRILPSPPLASGKRILVHPIRVFDDRQGEYETIGAAKIIFDPEEGRVESIPIGSIIIVSIAFTILLVGLFTWWLNKKLTTPIARLADQVDQWRYGHRDIEVHTPFHEWQGLYRSLIKWLEDIQK